jgi:hypothetical protein
LQFRFASRALTIDDVWDREEEIIARAEVGLKENESV